MGVHSKHLGSDDLFFAQSGEVCQDEQVSSETNHQIMRFISQTPAYVCEVPSMYDPSYDQGYQPDTSFKEFMARPVKISSYNWTINGSLDQKLNPWALLLDNARVSNRINNFRSLRGRLHVRVLINGGPFYTGRAMVSYLPLPTGDSSQGDDKMYSTSVFRDIIPASQRPRIFLDPTTNSGGDMVLPFFYDKNGVDITAASDDVADMGELWIRSINNLGHANGGLPPTFVEVTVYAWFDDITLFGPTSENAQFLIAQSGKVDEYEDKVVSGTATAVAKAAASLADVPLIGKYAKATEVGANTVASVARRLGYSKPRDVTETHPMKPQYVGEMATTNGRDTSVTLATDVKQELSIDPSTVGLGSVDELSIPYISGKETYLTTFNWADGSAAPDTTVLFSIPVGPQYVYDYSLPNIFPGPTAFLTTLFAEWSGSMRYRFQVASSAIHKGRLLIQWDAGTLQSTAGDDSNTVYSLVVDIAKERDFTIEVGWASPFGYLNCEGLYNVSGPAFKLDGTVAANSPFNSNGTLTVSVLNAHSSSTVGVNVFASGEKIKYRNPSHDYEFFTINHFALASGDPLNCTYDPMIDLFVVQSGMAVEESTSEPSKPRDQDAVTSFGNTKIMDTDLVYYGEGIDSLRTLLRRYTYVTHYTMSTSSLGAKQVVERKLSAFPLLRGTVFGTATLAANSLLSYVAPLYKGWRGSIRWKWVKVGSDNNNGFTSNATFVIRQPNSNMSNDVSYTQTTISNPRNDVGAGVIGYIDEQAPTLEFEVPFQVNRRFANARIAENQRSPSYYSVRSFMRDNGTAFHTKEYWSYVAAGEDFQLFFFAGVPRLTVSSAFP